MKQIKTENYTLYNADCLSVIPSLSKIDAVVTDPPYGIDFKYRSHVDSPDNYAEFMRDVVNAIKSPLGGGVALFWQAMINAPKWHEWFPSEFRIFAACKGFVQFRPTPVQYSFDPVIFYGEIKNKPSVYAKDYHVQRLAPFGANREGVDHPCPRPIEQVMYIIETFTAPNDLVLDPFMGSGTTGIACMRLGRKFIGIEIDEKYFDLAAKRIEAETMQAKLFNIEQTQDDLI